MPLYETKVYQDMREHDAFIALLREEKVRSYLEIGLGVGGSLWRIANTLPQGSRVVGIDLHISKHPVNQAEIGHAITRLNQRGYDAHLIVGDSTAPDVIAQARALAPFDAIFIDGSHTYEGVKADWENYGPMGRVIAFHDIAYNDTWKSAKPGKTPNPIFVPLLWHDIKLDYRHRELCFNAQHNYYGIGVLWRPDRELPDAAATDVAERTGV